MSLVPILFRDVWDEVWDAPLRSSRIADQHFATGLMADDLFNAVTACPRKNYRRHGYYRPWRTLQSQQDTGSVVDLDSNQFQINLDVQQFQPDELSVKTVDDTVVVEGKHEEKQDEHGYVSRHFVRKYVLPADHDAKEVSSSLSSDGVLTVRAPKKTVASPSNQRIVPITMMTEEQSQDDQKK
ncbi:protein lethal(2)essential for life-like [Toxorhynchites rutilus septentrionalis]|uniref:protein lethal(2)essential for life-like n=1 Tax=Toxorhynchites rutilus septentrionalis TaxID=329112 RepID=UPI002478797E|nr:protein lethal(2)essential for life-like [Toxorhynchites rutilus septentrionalis]